MAERFGIARVESDWRAIIEARDIDAVVVCTPPAAHLEIVLAAPDAGKHVLGQTRIATSADEGNVMRSAAAAARERGVRSMLVPPVPWYRGSRFEVRELQLPEIAADAALLAIEACGIRGWDARIRRRVAGGPMIMGASLR